MGQYIVAVDSGERHDGIHKAFEVKIITGGLVANVLFVYLL